MSFNFEVLNNTNIKETFIGSWKINDDSVLNNVVSYFNESEHKHPGVTLEKNEVIVNKLVKESTDVEVSLSDFRKLDSYFSYLDLFLMNYSFYFHGLSLINKYGIIESPTIQHYPIGGGYKTYHCERSTFVGNAGSRVLVFMTFLNTIDNKNYEGGTEFYHQNLKVKCEKGVTLIWPSEWTHIHKGIVSTTSEKMIITGWLNFL